MGESTLMAEIGGECEEEGRWSAFYLGETLRQVGSCSNLMEQKIQHNNRIKFKTRIYKQRVHDTKLQFLLITLIKVHLQSYPIFRQIGVV